MKKNKVTNEQLLKAVQQGFKNSQKYTDVRVDNLAGMVQKGFDGVDKKINLLTSEINSKFDRIEGRLDAMEMELMDIKKKLENVIDRREFEILKDKVNNLERRLEAALSKKK